MKLPKFVPILTGIAQRIDGRDMDELLRSPTALARALADTQTAIGHDGVLCVFEPDLLLSACLGSADRPPADAAALTPPDRLPATPPLNALLGAIEPLRHLLPGHVAILATFTGPGLLARQLEAARADTFPAAQGYTLAVLRSAVRAALDLGADGIALIEEAEALNGAEAQRAWRAVRKLVDFYQAGLYAFVQTEASRQTPSLPAHCRFELAVPGATAEPVAGILEDSLAAAAPPKSTAGDVPADTEIANLKSLASGDTFE